MQIEIRPEPSPGEREALLRAIAAVDRAADQPSPWWQAGLREAVADDSDEDG